MQQQHQNANAMQLFRAIAYPHLPSFHPVRHLSSHLLQSKLLFPNFSLTALCASHIHRPKSSLLLTRGSLPSFIQDLKSSAHDQQGYILPNKLMNCFVSLCWVEVGRSGYAAVRACKKVQVERPSCSTSGGQSEGIDEREAFAVEGAVVVWAALGLLSLEAGAERAMAIHEETEVQERHLWKVVSEETCDVGG
jgi:hypothetical protein